MSRSLPFPYPEGRFPDDLGAVIQRSVLAGNESARVVIHDADGEWAVGDGVNDPNEPDACVATHLWHVIARDPTIAALASMPPGHIAERSSDTEVWTVGPHSYEDA